MSDDIKKKLMDENELKEQKVLYRRAEKYEKEKTTQSFVCLQTVDGSTVLVEPEIAQISPQLCLQLQSGVGYTKSNPICVPPQVKPDILASVFEYCRFYGAQDRTDKDCNLFDDKFLRKDLETLSQLGHASNYLQLELLYDKLCKAIALSVSNGSPDEKHRFLNHAIEHAKPEKLDLYINSFGGSRGRLLKKLSAKKKKELEELKNAKKVEATVEAQKREDTNSVDDLVSFIDGGDGDSMEGKTKKKKNHRKKKGQNVVPSVCPSAEPSSSIRDGSLPLEDEFDDGDYDPAWKEKLDRSLDMSDDIKKKLSMDEKELEEQKESLYRRAEKEETTQSFVCLQTVDGSTVLVEPEIAQISPQLCLQLQSGVGYTKSNPICVPPQVKPDILASVFEYCRFYGAQDRTDKDCNLFDDKFLRKDLETLSQLGHASHYLQLELLSDKLCKAIALSVSNGSPDEKHRFLNHAIEHAKPEKLDLYINSFGGSRGRLLKKLSVKKKKELEELKNAKKVEATVEATVEAQKREDTNSVDDLVSFIDGGNGDSKEGKTKKKKNHRKKKGQNVVPSVCPIAEPSYSIRDGSLPLEDEFDDGDYDPAWKKKIDREVEDFARRLNVPYHEIRPDMNSLSRESRQVPHSTDGNSLTDP